MNVNNEKHFSRRSNVRVFELLQILTDAAIKSYFEKLKNEYSWNSKMQQIIT